MHASRSLLLHKGEIGNNSFNSHKHAPTLISTTVKWNMYDVQNQDLMCPFGCLSLTAEYIQMKQSP